MTMRDQMDRMRTLRMALLGVVFLSAGLALAGPGTEAAQIIPSVGLTKAVDADDTKTQLGLALRGSVIPSVLQSEIAAGYRKEEFFGGDLEAKMWPVTASLLLTPIPTLHADAGVGWYHTTFDYSDPLLEDETKQEFGVHAGGGITVPFSPVAGLDMTGRYVFMQKQESKLIPDEFDPNFWTLSLGLAFKL